MSFQTLREPDRVIPYSIVANESGVLAGTDVFQEIGGEIYNQISDAKSVRQGDTIFSGQASWEQILKRERTALNLVGYLSGIATQTKQFCDEVQSVGSNTEIVSTRKILPGFRELARYAVRCGGGGLHRAHLSTFPLLKKNHWKALGGLSMLLERLRNGNEKEIEVEVESLTQLEEVLRNLKEKGFPKGFQWVLLDNFSLDDARVGMDRLRSFGFPLKVELSGGVRSDTVAELARLGPDRISVGSLTHSVKSLSLSVRYIK